MKGPKLTQACRVQEGRLPGEMDMQGVTQWASHSNWGAGVGGVEGRAFKSEEPVCVQRPGGNGGGASVACKGTGGRER